MNRPPFLFPAVPVSRPAPLALAIRALLAGGVALGAGLAPVRAELPVPADVLVRAGAGNVLPPVVNGGTMTIRQLSDKATLDWKSFNIGPDNAVRFEQPSATSVALNNIHQGDPSRIQGRLTANGQVYLVNQNGFVFGKNAEVNVNALVASTLNISEETFRLGIAQVFDQSKLPALAATDAQGRPTQVLFLKDAHGQPVLDQHGQKVKVQIFVESGARLKTNASGGRIILAAPSITNRGRIEAEDGQVILAASEDKVYLQQADADSGVRGLLVEVGTGGDVNNVGKILAERGNASLIGFAVNQEGLVSATTSVRLNGSVRLLAREGIQDPVATDGALRPGSTRRVKPLDDGLGTRADVNLRAGSQTRVDLDADKAETAVDAQAQSRSRIEIGGARVYARANATVRATSGRIAVTAVDDPTNPALKGDSRIYLENGSRIDASGRKKVVLPMSRNVVEVELRSNELRDAPLQRNGVLHGQTVKVDLRRVDGEGRIPIADLSGALERIARNIDERSTAGGRIDLVSSGDVIARPGSVLDFSGGSVAYRGGTLETTQLVAEGRLYDLATADPDRHYDGILGETVKLHRKWGVVERWSLPGLGLRRFEPGYVEGKPGGSLNIAAYDAMLDGLMQGRTVDGPLQREPGRQAAGSTLAIDLNRGNLLGKQDVVFARQAAAKLGPDDPFPRQGADSAIARPLALAPDLFQTSGIRHASLKTNGGLRIAEGARVSLPEHGSLDLAAAGFDVRGSIVAPGGEVSLEPVTTPVDGRPTPLPSAITLGRNAAILAGGTWVNDLRDAQHGQALKPVVPDGGQVSLVTEQGDLHLEAGSRIDVSGGAWLQGDAQLTAGRAGAIELTAATHLAGAAPSSLVLDGELSGWAVKEGGRLGLTSNEIVIGGDPAGETPGRTPLVLSPDFFRQGGFADYHLGANLAGITVAADTRLEPLQLNRLLPGNAAAIPSGGGLAELARVVTLPDFARQPASLSLTVAQLTAHDRGAALRIEPGAVIATDPEASVHLSSDTSVLVEGAIVAPAGHIALAVTAPTGVDSGFFPSQGIWLGSGGRLSAPGVFQSQPDGSGLRTGEVLPGGSITLTAARGYIVAQPGSALDASGGSAVLEFREPAATGLGFEVAARRIPSAGGQITLKAGEGILADGSFTARSGGPQAAGGTLAVELNGPMRAKSPEPIPGGAFPDDGNPRAPRTIVVSAGSDTPASSALTFGGEVPSDLHSGQARLSSSTLDAGGFGTIALRTDAANGTNYVGRIEFQGDVELGAGREIVLDSPVLAWKPLPAGPAGGGTVALNAPHIALGSTQSRIDARRPGGGYTTTLAPAAAGGDGGLSIAARGIDLVGGVSFDGYGRVDLASSGDVRAIGTRITTETKDYRGEFKLAGDLNIEAAQVYPATLTDYAFALSGEGRTLAIRGNGRDPGPVYSAGGALSLAAPHILQGGTLKAPFGTLSLNAQDTLELAAGSLTSVSGAGLAVPFGRGSGGLNWLYPLDAAGVNNRVIEAPPEKRIALDAPRIALTAGATVDLSGGGDLYAYEYITGPGGSHDVLDPADAAFAPKFAVIPGVQGISTPYDPAEYAGAGLKAGDSVHLAGGGGLPAGRYTLLPARYALLPGAWLVTPEAHARDLAPGETFRRLDGATVVAGRTGVAETGILDARWRGFAVEPGSVARTRSEFRDYSADRFFAAKAATAVPRLPRDAGGLAVSAGQALTLGADLIATAAGGGRGGEVDIGANRLAIVGRREEAAGAAADTVSLVAEDLDRLDVRSLLLGGLRGRDTDGERLTVVADRVEVAGDAALRGREILLAARTQVAVRSGAVVESTGTEETAAADLRVSNRATGSTPATSDGALLRVSALGQGEIIRDKTVTGTTGVLVVESGAQLKAAGSMVLDSTKDTRFEGELAIDGGSLALRSSRISLGAAPAGTAGLVLADPRFSLDALKLTSATDIGLYGAVAIAAQTLSIDAAALNGYDHGGATASLSADTLRLANTGAKPGAAGTGHGELVLDARLIELDGGTYALNGFDRVSLSAREALLGALPAQTGRPDTARLAVGGDLILSAGHVGGAAGATTVIDATGHPVSLNALPPPENLQATTGLGASWSITADAIESTARFDLPSGILNLKALRGDLALNAGTAVDVSGQAVAFDSLTRYTPGGRVRLEAERGRVRLADGASLDLSGAEIPAGTAGPASDAGRLTVAAPSGGFDWNGRIAATAPAGSRQGRFELDAAGFGAGGLSALNGQLAAAGFTEEVTLRQRTGDVLLPAGATVKAHRFELAADAGAVELRGRIDASGATGGTVAVHGAHGIALAAGASIDAQATDAGAEGGRVTLDTVQPRAGAAGSGLLDLSASAAIAVAGGAGGSGGTVHLRTGRDAEGRIAATEVDTRIEGSSRAVLEATRVYTDRNSLDADAIAALRQDTAAFMATAQAPADRSGAGLVLAPGLAIRSGGDLTLAAPWDFMVRDAQTGDLAFRFRGVPGYLSLEAAGDLRIDASLSDGFATAPLPDPLYGTLKGFEFRDSLQPGRSWSFRLAAGGDVLLADSYTAPDPAAPSTSIDRQVVVRTGTGRIDIEAGGDIRFVADARDSKAAAAVYTAGRPADYTFEDLLLGRVPGIAPPGPNDDLADYLRTQDPKVLAGLLRWGYFNAFDTGTGFLAEYPLEGGDIGLRAGGDIAGLQTGQLTSDWLVRGGTFSADPAATGRRPTAWGINLSGSTTDEVAVGTDAAGKPVFHNVQGRRFFNQNVGALGGGRVEVRADGDVRDLSVMIPTTGKPFGILTTPANAGKPNLSAPGGALDTRWLENGTVVGGGGDLAVEAGGDIRGGEYYTGLGSGRLAAGGSIAASTAKLGAVVELGDGRFDLAARKDVVLGTVLNPTVLPQQRLPDRITQKNSFFFTYAPDSAVNLAATAGNVILQNDVETLKSLKGYTASDGTGFELAVYPGTLRGTATAGDLRIDNSYSLFPSATGQLELLAAQDIGTDTRRDSIIKVNLSDADPVLLPRVSLPEPGLLGDLPRKDYKTRERLDPESPVAGVIHAATPPHRSDAGRAVVIANAGDIAFPTGIQMKFFLPKAAEVRAGRDIRNLSLSAQNLFFTDITRVRAGRDLVFDSRLDANGGVVPIDQRIQVAGPGRLQVLAGRDINLGGSSGFLTVGNLVNPALPKTGAAIDVLAGLSGPIDPAGFIDRYLPADSPYLKALPLLDAEGNDLGKTLSPEQKRTLIEQLPDEAQLGIVQGVLFEEIKQSAAAAAAAPESRRAALYRRGFEAIAALFPGQEYRGDLNLVFSQIKSLAGGDINLAVPGGQVDVGLAGQVGGIRKTPDQLGIVAQQQGDLNAVSLGNFNVNQSRVFTLGGGDIALWSSQGSIDAGKGAKSAISAPPPVTTIDEKGNVVTLFPPIISGSGIQAIDPSDRSLGQGNVYLAAPGGVVNAGEAGISGGRVVIAATAVIGASNIQASGGTVGVPTAVAAPVVPAGADAAAAGVAKSAARMADDGEGQQAARDAADRKRAAVGSLLSADVVGYGPCSVADVRDGKAGCGGG
jgi:filamentous hemagglutinin